MTFAVRKFRFCMHEGKIFYFQQNAEDFEGAQVPKLVNNPAYSI